MTCNFETGPSVQFSVRGERQAIANQPDRYNFLYAEGKVVLGGNNDNYFVSLKRRVLIIAACISACVFAFLIYFQLFVPAQSPPLKLFGFISAGTSGIMLLVGVGLAAWGASIYVRCPDLYVRRRILLLIVLLAAWMLVVLIKYQIRNDRMASFMWYLYYVPMIATPLICYFCALHLSKVKNPHAEQVQKVVFATISIAMIILVLSNNLHQFVFVFDFKDRNWGGNYEYGPGYWIVATWIVFLYTMFFARLVPVARRQLRSAFLPLVVIGVCSLIICGCYILRNIFIFTTNISLIFVLIIVASIETCFDVGIFPSYFRYEEAFRKLPLKIGLFSKELELSYSTEQANKFENLYSLFSADGAREAQGDSWSPEMTSEEKARLVELQKTGTITHKEGEKVLLERMFPVTGGFVVSSVDVTGLQQQREQLEERNARLARKNELLNRVSAGRERLARIHNEQALLTRIETSLEEKVQEINSIANSLSSGNSDDDKAQRKAGLTRIKFLTAYCKRKASAVITAYEKGVFDPEHVKLIFSETTADLRSLGIECGFLINLHQSLTPEQMSQLYECVYDFLLIAFQVQKPVAMLSISSPSTGDGGKFAATNGDGGEYAATNGDGGKFAATNGDGDKFAATNGDGDKYANGDGDECANGDGDKCPAINGDGGKFAATNGDGGECANGDGGKLTVRMALQFAEDDLFSPSNESYSRFKQLYERELDFIVLEEECEIVAQCTLGGDEL